MAVTKKNSYSTFFGTAAEMATFADCALGDKFWQTDTSTMYMWTGSAWVLESKTTLEVADVEIGAVELKGGANDNRAVVNADGSINTIGTSKIDQSTAHANEVVLKQNLIDSTKTIEIQTPFAKNTAAGTETVAVRIPKPTAPVLMYKMAMHNPSIDSAITVKLFNRRTFTQLGQAQAGDATHITLSATANPTDDHYNGMVITITGGTGSGQIRTITDYVGATCIAEVSAWETQPDATSTYSIALVKDSLAWTGSFAKASLTSPIVKANDSDIITGLFDNGCDVYAVLSNDTAIANADASRFEAIFQLIPLG